MSRQEQCEIYDYVSAAVKRDQEQGVSMTNAGLRRLLMACAPELVDRVSFADEDEPEGKLIAVDFQRRRRR